MPATERRKSTLRTEPDLVTVRQAGLRYVTDQTPGIQRLHNGHGFLFRSATGRPLKDGSALKRIRSLAIPPAWKNVWICPSPHGHIQATGRDDRGRKQYRYHRHWHEARDEKKFGRMMAFGRALPRIRLQVRRDLRSPGFGREKILAAVVRLLDLSAIRVGNGEYANHNNSYGLTTLRNRHAKVNGSTIHLRFRGKSGKPHALSIEHPRLARIVKKCQDLPGQELFQWLDENGEVHAVSSGHVNDYIARIAGADFTSKDFRTWTGTVVAALALREFNRAASQARTRTDIARAIERVAARLGNTPAVCRKCYVHPAVLDAYSDGTLHRLLPSPPREEQEASRATPGLRPEEAAVLKMLKRYPSAGDEAGLQKKLEQSLRCIRRQTRHP